MANKKVHIELTTPIREMGDALELSSMVKVDSALLAEVTDGDNDPKFVISVIDEQKSKKNINYDQNALTLIAEQVNKTNPTGYLGHIKDQDRDTAFPAPQVLWLGASVNKPVGGKAQLITKGYLIPEGTARGLIRRRVINTVSWAGDAMLAATKGGYDVVSFALESIDFARKNREGMSDQNLVLVTEEMDDDKSKGGKKRVATEHDDDYESIVGHLTMHDLKTHNPGLLKTITEMAKDEVKDETAVAVAAKEEELNKQHEKELEEVPEISAMQKIMDILHIEKLEDAADTVVNLLAKLDELGKEAVKSWFENEILAKKVTNEKARKLVARLIPVTEMEGDWRSEKGIEKIKNDLEGRVDDALENDDEIKTVIREMGADRGGLRLGRTRRDDGNGDDDGGNGDDGGDDSKSKYKPTSRMGVEYVEV